jgi:broad specificity phosphatase PhoE
LSTVFFISHPEVVVDPLQPIPLWSLSPRGEQRMRAFAQLPLLASLRWIFSSSEQKAREAAQLLAQIQGLSVLVRAELGENDRSSTGYLAKDTFEQAADRFFAQPERSYRGWETAQDAQRRIVGAFTRALEEAGAGDLAIVSHGAVGTLLKCFLKATPINRGEDQPRQGNYFTIERSSRRLTSDWTPLPEAPA